MKKCRNHNKTWRQIVKKLLNIDDLQHDIITRISLKFSFDPGIIGSEIQDFIFKYNEIPSFKEIMEDIIGPHIIISQVYYRKIEREDFEDFEDIEDLQEIDEDIDDDLNIMFIFEFMDEFKFEFNNSNKTMYVYYKEKKFQLESTNDVDNFLNIVEDDKSCIFIVEDDD